MQSENSDKQLNQTKKIFIRIPKKVYLNQALNDTEKYLYGALLSLYKLFGARGIPVQTARLSKLIKVSQRLIQLYLNTLKEKKLLAIETVGGKRRVFLWETDDDAYVLIPDDMVYDPRASVPYKVSYGLAFVSMNGYEYQSMEELSAKMQLSSSSVYRHINYLKELGYISKDISASGYRFLTHDAYSESQRIKQSKNPSKKIYNTGERQSKKLGNAPPVPTKEKTPEDDRALMYIDKMFQSMKTKPQKGVYQHHNSK